MAKTTASASGTKRNLATPVRKNMGTNTMQIESVETRAGTAICCAPSRMARTVSLPCARLRLMFSISTVASSTRMPTARANPPSVMMLMVSCSALKTKMEMSTESGMEMAMIRVLRQLRRKPGGDLRQLGVNIFHYIERGGVTRLVNGDENAALAVHTHDIDLGR